MARTVMAVFDSKFLADKAVHDLQKNGLSSEMIELLARPARKVGLNTDELLRTKIQNEIRIDSLNTGLQIGAGVGGGLGIAGGLIASTGAITLPMPELVTLMAGGPLSATAMAFVVAGLALLVGMLSGGFATSLIGLGIQEEELQQYARTVREDQVVVAVLADWDIVDPVLQILNRHNPLELQEKAYSRLKAGPDRRTAGAAQVHPITREGEEHH